MTVIAKERVSQFAEPSFNERLKQSPPMLREIASSQSLLAMTIDHAPANFWINLGLGRGRVPFPSPRAACRTASTIFSGASSFR